MKKDPLEDKIKKIHPSFINEILKALVELEPGHCLTLDKFNENEFLISTKKSKDGLMAVSLNLPDNLKQKEGS